jgi:hypothetical protein
MLKERTMFDVKSATAVSVKTDHGVCKAYVQGDEVRLAADMTLVTSPSFKFIAIKAARRAEAKV